MSDQALPRLEAAARNARGFTLLEILVVLVLVALAAGFTAPAAGRWLDAARERAWQDELRAQLRSQPLRAFHAGQSVRLDAQALRALVPGLPADVEIELSAPLSYGPSGAAAGAELRIRRPGAVTQVWRIEPLTGELSF